jgi:hypothetical protein
MSFNDFYVTGVTRRGIQRLIAGAVRTGEAAFSSM